MNTMERMYLTGVIDNAGDYSSDQIENAALTLCEDDAESALSYLAEALRAQALLHVQHNVELSNDHDAEVDTLEQDVKEWRDQLARVQEAASNGIDSAISTLRNDLYAKRVVNAIALLEQTLEEIK